MVTDVQILQKINAANLFIDKKYMESLQDYRVQPIDSHSKKHSLTRLFHIDKIVYDKNEDINDKLVSVFHSVMPFCKNIVLILRGHIDSADLYLGIRSHQISIASTAGDVLHDAFLGNFPGSRMQSVKTSEIQDVFFFNSDTEQIPCPANVAYINILPSERNSKQNGFVQGIEKFVDTMRGSEYVCEILATPISDSEIEARMGGFEELYSALFPFSKKTSSHGHNEGVTLTEGITENISNSISNGISRATGHSAGHLRGNNSSTNVGMHMLLNFGISEGTSEGWNTGSNDTSTNSSTRTSTDSFGHQKSTSRATGTTDNLTVEFRDKSIENLLEKIECHMKRLKAGTSYGVWEVGSYFLAKEKKVAAIAATTYRSLLLGDGTGIERPNFTLFDCSESRTQDIIESLTFCEHPSFLIPSFDTPNEITTTIQEVTPTNYINGKELALLFSLPRKSICGVTVASMAEFGRNVPQSGDSSQRTVDLGNVFYMGQPENTFVELDIDSLTSHCFITGSTGCGKSNTVYNLIEHIIGEPFHIPVLVVEPAKGEYRNQFRNVPNINLFCTNPQIDQMLKLNPFSFCEGIHILEHLDRLVEIFNGCWEMYAAMPAILKEAIELSYVNKGWDLLNSVYTGEGDPVFPTFVDVLDELPQIINSSEYSSDTKSDYIGALVTRVNSMTNGIYGQIFCDDFEVENRTLFDENTIVDLSRVGSTETKSLIMGILVLKLTEYRMANAGRGNSVLKHITVLEEAHNILKNSKNIQSSTSNSVISKSVEMIVNSIAEMRTYGEGFVIVDQSPTSVDIAAIKNTNTKIIMRLPEAEDCKIAGHSVSLSNQQVEELSKLETGIAVVMQNNWSEPILTKIGKAHNQFEGFEQPITFERMKSFRSTVLSELIEQFEVTDEQNIEKVTHTVENFDIPKSKKIDMCRMLNQFGRIMSNGYDSIVLGRTMLRLIGCDDVFRRAEKFLQYEKQSDGQSVTKYTEESLGEWYQYIESAIPQYISIPDSYQRIVEQYILHSKRFEAHAISYSILYRQLYQGII